MHPPELVKSLKSYAPLKEDETNVFIDSMHPKTLSKKELLLDFDEVCGSWCFVMEGSLREYYIDEELEEVTTNLFTEHSWVLNHASFTGQKPSKCRIEAFESCKLLEISIHDLHNLIGKSPSFFALGKILEVDARNAETPISPEDKYLSLLSEKPDFVKKFPLKYIASYLGMTPETLSRVRARIQ